MTDCPFKAGETYRTRDGFTAFVESHVNDELFGRVSPTGWGWLAHSWHGGSGVSRQKTGGFDPRSFDLILPKREVWVAVFRDGYDRETIDTLIAETKAGAERLARADERAPITILGPVEVD